MKKNSGYIPGKTFLSTDLLEYISDDSEELST
mgnify:CR=1